MCICITMLMHRDISLMDFCYNSDCASPWASAAALHCVSTATLLTLPSSFSLPLSLQFSQHILHIGTKDFFARQLKQLTENVALRKDMAKVEQQQLMPCDATSINVSTTRECLPVCVCVAVCVCASVCLG